MPLYEYRCSACDHLEEVLQKATEPAPATCPSCGKEATLAKEVSRTSFQLKGGGWYKDLYSSVPADKGKKADAGTASKSEAKSDSASSASSSSSSASASGGSSGGASGGSSGGSSSTSSASSGGASSSASGGKSSPSSPKAA